MKRHVKAEKTILPTRFNSMRADCAHSDGNEDIPCRWVKDGVTKEYGLEYVTGGWYNL